MNIINILFTIFIVLLFICMKRIINNIEKKYIFQPTKINNEEDMQKINMLLFYMYPNCNIDPHKIKTPDHETLDALYHHDKLNDKLIIYAHGNGGNIYNRLDIIKKLRKYGSVLTFDYRGYGLSTGKPSEKGLHIDIFTIWTYANTMLGYKPENIILYGSSLGCSMVLWLGQYLLKKKMDNPKGIIIEAGFYDIKTLACEILHPSIKYFMEAKFNNIQYIKRIKYHIPLLIIHSHEDEMINISHAYKILEDSQLSHDKLIVISGTHNEPKMSKSKLDKMENFIKN